MPAARKDAFKVAILSEMRAAGVGVSVSKPTLLSAVREKLPELFDDQEPCYLP